MKLVTALTVLMMTASVAHADGAVVSAASLPAEVRTSLGAEISAAKKANPGPFAAVASVRANMAKMDAQVAIIKQATGITDAEIIRIPFLHYPSSGYSLAYQPGTVNGVLVNPTNFIAPDPHGPVINGKDIFKTQMEQALAPDGITVRWVDDWNLYHRLAGEVHCGTNATRAIPSTKWWETGR